MLSGIAGSTLGTPGNGSTSSVAAKAAGDGTWQLWQPHANVLGERPPSVGTELTLPAFCCVALATDAVRALLIPLSEAHSILGLGAVSPANSDSYAEQPRHHAVTRAVRARRKRVVEEARRIG
jgi:hypothetical protein